MRVLWPSAGSCALSDRSRMRQESDRTEMSWDVGMHDHVDHVHLTQLSKSYAGLES